MKNVNATTFTEYQFLVVCELCRFGIVLMVSIGFLWQYRALLSQNPCQVLDALRAAIAGLRYEEVERFLEEGGLMSVEW